MKLKKMWWIWIIPILLLILIFPKTCGKANLVSNTTEYNCGGIQASFININNTNSSYNWCYGVCFEKTIKPKTNKTIQPIIKQNPGFVSDISQSLKKIILPMGIIFLAIGFIKFITSLKSKK